MYKDSTNKIPMIPPIKDGIALELTLGTALPDENKTCFSLLSVVAVLALALLVSRGKCTVLDYEFCCCLFFKQSEC